MTVQLGAQNIDVLNAFAAFDRDIPAIEASGRLAKKGHAERPPVRLHLHAIDSRKPATAAYFGLAAPAFA
ncbi:hypothetical protein [Ensifer canadensis]